MAMGVPQCRCMVYFMENPMIFFWVRTGKSPILGNLHMYDDIDDVCVWIYHFLSYLSYVSEPILSEPIL